MSIRFGHTRSKGAQSAGSGTPSGRAALGASEATVRRDVNALADAGRLRRVHGGAESLQPRHESHLAGVPFVMNRSVAAEQKRAIAKAAAALIEDGESIIINGGTTTFALVEFLADRSLDVLTNSLPIVNQLLATGCYGLNRFGVMESDPLIVQAHGKLLRRAEELVVLADSRKFRQRSPMIVAGLDRITTLITDDGATEEELAVFRDAGVRVITVPAREADAAGDHSLAAG